MDRSGDGVHALAVTGIAAAAVLLPLAEHDVAIGGWTLDPFLIVAVIALLLSIPCLRRSGLDGVPPSSFLLPGVLFFAIAAASIIANGSSFAMMLTLGRYLAYMVLAFVTAIVARDPAARRIVLWGLIAGAAATFVAAIIEYPTVVAANRAAMDAGITDTERLRRLSATFENANFYAEYLLVILGATVSLTVTERSIGRALGFIASVATLLALLMTYTRGSWVALLVAAVVVLLLVAARHLWLLGAVAVSVAVLVPRVLERLASSLSVEGTAAYRVTLWKVAGGAIAERPLFGAGIGRFYEAFERTVLARPELSLGVFQFGAHNSYFTLAAETGVLGAFAFVWIVVEIVRQGFRTALRDKVDIGVRASVAAITGALLAFSLNSFTSNVFQHPQGAAVFWLLVGVQVSMVAERWGLPSRSIESPVRPHVQESLLGSSLTAALAAAVTQGIRRAAWSSCLARWLTECPDTTTLLLSRSLIGRALLGDGGERRWSRMDKSIRLSSVAYTAVRAIPFWSAVNRHSISCQTVRGITPSVRAAVASSYIRGAARRLARSSDEER